MFDRSTQTDDKQVTESNKSYYTPSPAISLPKGGGAVKGIGEKFAANPVTGTGTVSVPIALSPGRSGFNPQLSLSYDSGAGNGVFGFGWTLSTASITRKTDKGLPRYWNESESDVFILSGVEDLVPVLKDGKFDERIRDGYHIRQYRPRIEGLFARLESWTKIDSGEQHWKSLSKDNVTTVYGKTAESRIADPEQPTHVFTWLICESYDDKGNSIVHRYKSEDKNRSIGINTTQAHEQNRTPIRRATNRYLKRIQYGNLTPRQPNEDLSQRNDWLFEVVFDYGEHDRTNPSPQEPERWTVETVRHDSFSSYRAGFEVRTYRRCQRVMMFHHFPQEKGVGKNCLVRSTDFTYSTDALYSLLLSVKQTGYKRKAEGGYLQKSPPPLEFTYSEPNIDETVREVDRESLENLPDGLDGTRYQWVDLDGEGLSGFLTEQEGWFYKRNLSPLKTSQDTGKNQVEARFAPIELVVSKPGSGLENDAQFLDLAGDGQLDLVTLRSPTPGFYERTQDAEWESFIPFKSLPILNWDNPNVRFIDLNGDGHSDILITEDDCFVWHSSLAEDGFAIAQRVDQPWDEEKGARVVFADGTQSIYLADMSGDGLTDIVRIRNGEVCYWANLGYGKFGAKVTMDHAPWFDAPDLFNQHRIVLADIDGTGTTDILYLSGEGVQVYFNQSGNQWSKKRVLRSFPAIDNLVSVAALDLLGNGTACLVWSSSLPGDVRRAQRYIDLMGGQKPHLLVKTANNMGAETIVQYAPSTKFYLQDKFAGKPWITKLPFLVHVVERVETYDRISRNRFVTRYAYHHGYFDGVEREFRGFGSVEQWDTEEIGTIQAEELSSNSTNLDAASFVPPVHTKTWFHTGAYFEREKLEKHFRDREYYKLDPEAVILADTILPSGLTADEQRQACRALKGTMLRQEVYANDRSSKQPHPYTVTEQNFTIGRVQSQASNRHAIFFVHPRESLTYHYERNPADPRIGHEMVFEVDQFGNVIKSVSIAYPRRVAAYPEQAKRFITYTENRVFNQEDPALDWYRIGVPIETCTYEITGIPKKFPYQLETLRSQVATATEVPYETVMVSDRPQKRAIEWIRTLYRSNAQANRLDSTPLSFGKVESLALPCESFKMAFTPGLLAQIYDSKLTAAELNTLLSDEGKYQQLDSHWWIPSGQQQFDPNRFYLVTASRDPFGCDYAVTYDNYALLTKQTKDPLDNLVQVENDYRVMQPYRIIDPNQNHVVVAFDSLGMVAGTAILGKIDADGTSESGDSLADFITDLSVQQMQDFLRSPRTVAANLLGQATTRIIYDLDRFKDSSQPLVAATITRETHVSDLPPGTQSIVQVSFSYSDGFGREIQKKIQAESGNAPQRESNAANPNLPGKLILENGKPKLVLTSPRWVGNGRTIFNNKGKPVKQYEPFFSSTHLYEDEPEMVMTGVTPILFYDSAERLVATLHPNHTYEKAVFDPWQQTTWDVNDTIVQTAPNTVANDPKTDPDVGEFFRRLPDSEYLPTWHTRFSTSASAAERDAAQKTLAHAGTPAIAHLDTLGRPFLAIADNGAAGNYNTHVTLDLEGNQLIVTDARNNPVMVQAIVQLDAQRKLVKNAAGQPTILSRANDLLGHKLYSYSMDAGERWTLNNVAGHPIRAWDSRNHQLRYRYDKLQRPTHLFVQQENQPERLVERVFYGEQHPEAVLRNLRGQVFQQYDGAGVVSHWQHDFKGNLLRSSRRIARDYRQQADWLTLAELELDCLPQVIAAANSLLESKVYDVSSAFDGLNRPIQLTTPDRSVMIPVFNEANLLNQVKVKLRSSQVETLFVKNIDYDEKGQRSRIEYGNDAADQGVVKTEYQYDRETLRLIQLRTTRKADGAVLQNLSYTYDPIGNITNIQDDAQQTIYFNGEVVSPFAQYQYDALYRLMNAAGREHIGQTTNQPTEARSDLKPHYDFNDWTRRNLPHPNQGQAMRNYAEEYQYDEVGNILAMIHRANGNLWQRSYDYAVDNNRLLRTSLPEDRWGNYEYDVHGNMTRMPHLSVMEWNYKNELQATQQQVVNEGTGEKTYYVYDAAGQRVRKVTELREGVRKDERLYLGGFEIYRSYDVANGAVKLERETLHVMDDDRRIALMETKTVDIEVPNLTVLPMARYQLDNHLGSASLELDGAGAVISYEEYYPYGSTSYQAGRSAAEVSLKRYRYTGKERDEETGLAYHGARYYTPWLGRWTSCDPLGIEAGINLFQYVKNRPIALVDPNGTTDHPPKSDPNAEWAQQEIRRLAGQAQSGPSLELQADGSFRTIFQAKETVITSAEARGETQAASTQPQQPPPEPDHSHGFYPMKGAEEQLGKQASEAFKGGRYLEGLIGLGLQKFMSPFVMAEDLMPYNIPDHFLSAGQYAKRWIWYDMRGQSGKGLLELAKGHLEAASIVGSVELGAEGLKMVAPSGLELKVPEIGGAANGSKIKGSPFNDEMGWNGANNCTRCTAAFLDSVRTRGVAPGEITSSQYSKLENRTIERINSYLETSLEVKLGERATGQMPEYGHYVIHPDPYILNGRDVAPHVMVGWDLGYGSVFYDPQLGRRVGTPASYYAYKVKF